MATIQIKNVPDDVHRTMGTRAAKSGMSLQEYLLARLTADARQPTLDEVLDEAGRRTGGSVPIAEAASAVRADRDSR
jgi:plasmid stability protein